MKYNSMMLMMMMMMRNPTEANFVFYSTTSDQTTMSSEFMRYPLRRRNPRSWIVRFRILLTPTWFDWIFRSRTIYPSVGDVSL